MLTGDFFILNHIKKTEDVIEAEIELNASHKIFEGHFPGQPVVPGVCMMQIIKEILEEAISKKITLLKSDHAKFLSMIDPRHTKIVNAHIKYKIIGNKVDVAASLFKEEMVFLKYKSLFSIL